MIERRGLCAAEEEANTAKQNEPFAVYSPLHCKG